MLSIVAARMLGAERLGTQSLIAFAESLVFSVIVQSLTSACVRTLAAVDGQGNRAELIQLNWWAVKAHYASGLLSALLVFAYGWQRHDGETSWMLSGVSVFATAAGWSYGTLIVADRGWTEVGRERLVSQLLAAIMAIAAVLLGGGIEWIFIANILASGWVAVRLWAKARSIPREIGWQPPSGLWSIYGMLIATEVVNQVVARRSEFFILDRYSSDAQIAMYSVAFMLVSTVVMIPQSLGQAIMPVIARAAGGQEDALLAKHLTHALRITSVFSIPLTAYAVASGPDAVTALYGADFKPAGILTAWTALIVLTLPTWRLCADYLSGVARMRPVLFTGIVGGILDLGAAIVLIPRMGAGGAVAAKVIGQTVMSLLLVRAVKGDLPGLRLFDRGWWSTLGVSVIAAGAGVITAASLPPWLGLFASAAAVTLLLAVGCFIVKPLSQDDSEWLAGLVPAKAVGVLGPFTRN